MSHITTIDIEIRDLECLAEAAADLGLDLVLGKRTFRTYQPSTPCDHVLKLRGFSEAYEIGVVADPGKPGSFKLKTDFFMDGYGLKDKVGEGASKLRQKYAEKVVLKGLKPLKARGWNVSSSQNAQGEIVVRCLR